MTFEEACRAAYDGNFVSNINFSEDQSMHAFNGDLYYEDGPNLTKGNFLDKISKEEWAKKNWYIKYTSDKVDREKLKELHYLFKNRMCHGESYEDCIIGGRNKNGK